MRLLLDSHVALWWLDDHPSLGPEARGHVEDAEEVFFSAVTAWELGIKQSLGKLVMPSGLTAALADAGFRALSITAGHAELAPTLPPHHRDPFDRMLVAQAQLEALVIVTADRSLRPYAVDLVEARR